MEGEFGLAQLPEEIIDIICESLEAQDVTNLRYTCRSLQAKSDHQWALKFFGQTSFVLTRRSLTLLIELSKNERFAPCIRELQLVLVTFPPSKLSGILGECTKLFILPSTPLSEPMDVDNGKSSHASALAKKQGDRKKLEGKPEEPSTSQMIKRQRRATYQRNMHDQNMLRKRGIDIDMLTEALQNLGGLESFSILDQYSQTRPPWGVRDIHAGVGLWPETARCENRFGWYSNEITEVRKYHWEFSIHAVAVAMGAILRTGQKLKCGLTIEAAPYKLPLPQNPAHRRLTHSSTPGLTFATSQIPDLAPAFIELRELALSTYNYDRQDLVLRGHNRPLSWFSDFLPLLPAVKVFKLTGARQSVETYIFEALLASPRILPRLRELHLKKLILKSPALIKFLHDRSEVLEFFGAIDCAHEFGVTYFPILQTIRTLSAMRAIHLVGQYEWTYRTGSYVEGTRQLEGLQRRVLEIDKDRPEDFQDVLATIMLEEQLSTPGPRR